MVQILEIGKLLRFSYQDALFLISFRTSAGLFKKMLRDAYQTLFLFFFSTYINYYANNNLSNWTGTMHALAISLCVILRGVSTVEKIPFMLIKIKNEVQYHL